MSKIVDNTDIILLADQLAKERLTSNDRFPFLHRAAFLYGLPSGGIYKKGEQLRQRAI